VSAPWAVNNGHGITIVRALSGATTAGYYLDNNYRRVGFIFDGANFSQVRYPDASDTYLTAVAGATVYGNTFDGIAFSLTGTSFTQLDLGFRTIVEAVDGQRYLGYSGSSGISFIIDGQSSIPILYPNAEVTEAFGFYGNTAVGQLSYRDYTYAGFYFDGTSVLPLDSINGYAVRPRGIVGSTVVGSLYSSELGRFVGFVATVPTPVPEIDPTSFGSAFALLLGSLGLVERRARRALGLTTVA